MKKHHHLFIFVFIFIFLGISLYIVRDDLKVFLNNLISDFNNKERVENTTIDWGEEGNIKINNVDLPGGLRVFREDETPGSILSSDSVISLTNKVRKENGDLPMLIENSVLTISAQQKLKDMFDKQYFEHISPDNKNISDLARENNYEYILIGENLALGNFKNNEALVDAWMASAGHKANILNKNYTEIGVAVGKGKYEGRNVWMAVEHFGTPRSICPSIDDILYGLILINKNKLSDISKELEERQEKIKNGAIYEGMSFYEQISSYNKLVNDYNNLISETKIKIEEYNKQVQLFNSCLYSFK